MSYKDYEYDYHSIAEDADYIDQEENHCYNDDMPDWENYYHNLVDEID